MLINNPLLVYSLNIIYYINETIFITSQNSTIIFLLQIPLFRLLIKHLHKFFSPLSKFTNRISFILILLRDFISLIQIHCKHQEFRGAFAK